MTITYDTVVNWVLPFCPWVHLHMGITMNWKWQNKMHQGSFCTEAHKWGCMYTCVRLCICHACISSVYDTTHITHRPLGCPCILSIKLLLHRLCTQTSSALTLYWVVTVHCCIAVWARDCFKEICPQCIVLLLRPMCTSCRHGSPLAH